MCVGVSGRVCVLPKTVAGVWLLRGHCLRRVLHDNIASSVSVLWLVLGSGRKGWEGRRYPGILELPVLWKVLLRVLHDAVL